MKTVLLTATATLAAVAIAASLFLNSILGVFGLAATSIDTLQRLQASQRVVEKMQHRHADRQRQVSRKFAQRSGRRVASTALAAATVGTAAVAVTVASLEVMNYCEEKEALQEDANLLYGTDVSFDMERCLAEGKAESRALLQELKASSADAVAGALAETRRYSHEAWQAIREQTASVYDAATGAALDVWDDALAWWLQDGGGQP